MSEERDERWAERERQRAEREVERAQRERERAMRREERRTERDARREERHRLRAEMRARLGDVIRESVHAEVREGLKGKKWYFGFGDMGVGMHHREHGGHAEASEVVEKRFEVSGMPRLRVGNVSGETDITVGPSNEVFIRARKRVHGWSEERARRLLENVEIRMEQSGEEIVVEPRLFQQERGWLDLFRGGRVAVDFDIRVPRETNIDANTVSGDLAVTGTRGQHEVRSVSGDVTIEDVQGPMQVRSVSGDINVTGFAGRVEANSVSGEIEFSRSKVKMPDVVTVSGDVAIDAVTLPDNDGESRLKTVSGDIEVVIAEANAEVGYNTVSGDAIVEVNARVEKTGKRDRKILIGEGGPRIRVKSVSGDLKVARSHDDGVEAEEHEAAEAMPMAAPAAERPQPSAAAREILERVARGELSVDDAASALDAARRSA